MHEYKGAAAGTTIRDATRRDYGAISALFAQAAAFDSMFIGLARSERQRSRFFATYLRAKPITALQIDVACDARGIPVGAALWERMDVGRDPAVIGQIPHAVGFVRALGLVSSFRGVQLQRQLERHRPIEPHWYLKNIVIAESVRGTSIGSLLLQHRLDTLDETGQFAYLEARTVAHRRFFEGFGFVQGGVINGRLGRRFTGMFRNPGRRR